MSPAQYYEAMKQHWLFYHPFATPAEYEAAMVELARKAGI